MRSAWILLAMLGGQAAPQDASAPHVAGFERFGADGGEGGRLLLGELGCISCHAPDAAIAAHLSLKKAPTLTDAGDRLAAPWIRAFLADPQKVKPGTTMPRAGLSADEAEALTHFLLSLRGAKPLEASSGPAAKAREIFNRVGCAACHDPLDAPGVKGGVPLPDLKAKYAGPAPLAHFLTDPLRWRPSGRMPKLNLTQAEATALAAHFVGLPPREADDPADTVPGMVYEYFEGSWSKVPDFDQLRPVASGAAQQFDVKLAKKEDHIGLRFRGYLDIPRDGIYTFTTNSDDGSVLRIGSTIVVDNDGIHGPTEVSGSIALKKGKHAFSVGWIEGGGGEELHVSYEGPGIAKTRIPAAALSRPREGPPVARESAPPGGKFVPDPALAQKGRALFAAKGCASCHDAAPDLKPVPAKPLAALKSGACRPLDYALTPKQADAIRAALESPSPEPPGPALRIRRTLTALNCSACHERDGRGGVPAERNALFTTSYDDTGDEGRIPPRLDGVGDKLRREWIQTLLGSGPKVRPYMNTRMPVFGSANVGRLAEDLEACDARPAAAPPARDKDMVKAGRQLVGTKGLSCVQCHMFQNHKSLGIPGMELVQAAVRLRRDWFTKYLLDPISLRPGTRMPTFWPEGRSVRKDILDGDTPRQIEAIWQYLNEGGKAQVPVGIGPQPILLVPGEEALMYRNFIQGAGTRAIGVGYPERVHFAFDANQMRPALMWQGDFIDASKHWVDRGAGFQGPAGENVVALPDGAPFASQTPWPKETGRAAGYQFLGYDLDAKRRPAFLYRWGKVEARDFFEAVDGKPHPGFKRTLTLESKDPPAGAWFRAAAGRKIELQADGAYRLDGGLVLRVAAGGAPMLRGNELLVPLTFQDGRMTIVVSYAW